MQRSSLAAIFAALFASVQTRHFDTGRVPNPYVLGERHPRQRSNSNYRKSGPGRSHRQGKTKPTAVRMHKKLRSCGA